jgi:hypothetical protein
VLRRADNVRIHHRVNLFTRRGQAQLSIGRSTYIVGAKLRSDEFSGWLATSVDRPVHFGTVKGRNYWLFRNRWFWDNDQLNADQVFALLETRDRRQAATIARAQTIANMPNEARPYRRDALRADVKQLVWARDGGRCATCGSTSELQFDHVIPVVAGGSSDPENLQVLCGPCNRRKGASIS